MEENKEKVVAAQSNKPEATQAHGKKPFNKNNRRPSNKDKNDQIE